ncbi:MAG: hypothetical protein HOA81_09935 [Opitutales bacterium]|nr:hypothetical protein [Opitutales bacterium]
MSENVEVEINEAKASNSRTSRLARYSTAAAGVAAVSTLDVEAAMIKVVVTDAQAITNYTLDLGDISSGASTKLTLGGNDLYLSNNTLVSVALSASHSKLETYLREFDYSQQITGPFNSGDKYDNNFGGTNYYGFRVNGGVGYYNGWLNVQAAASNTFSLNSYGYNSTLNGAANAGWGTVSSVPDSGPGVVGLALIAAGAAGIRLLRKLRIKS